MRTGNIMDNTKTGSALKLLRFTGRAIGVIFGLYLTFEFLEYLSSIFEGRRVIVNDVVMLVFLVLIITSIILSFFKERMAAVSLIVSSAGLGIFLFCFTPSMKLRSTLVFAVPFFLSGLLLLFYSLKATSLRQRP